MANIVVAIATVFYVVLTAAVVLFMWLQTTREREAIRLQMYHALAIRLEEGRQHRRLLRDYVRKSKLEHGRVVFPMPDNIRDAADQTCREFDYLGMFDRRKLVDPRMVDHCCPS
jgi:hypothetical protein